MKTILYNPIFINPQAYYVFPRLTRYLQPDNESTAEPANYIGTIEVKVIAYGDTTLKRTYTNTDSIDLSEFKNTWIRISLFTKVGSCVLGEWKIGNMESDLPYIDPEVLASLKAVVIVGNKTNNDSDRAIVKNLVDPDNPFIISNAAFKLNSGFGKYEDDFTNWVAETGTKLTSDKITNSNPTKNWIAYRSSGVEFKEMHIRILGIPDNGVLYFQRPAADGGPIRMFNGDNNIPAFTSTGICGFFINNLTGLSWSNLVIEQIPSFEGAFVTDGIDDLITSTKTASEMGITEACTVISMIHQIDKPSNFITTNNIRTSGSVVGRNAISLTDKTGIYGWYKDNIQGSTINVINNILGDKADYTASASSNTNLSSKFSVVGYISNDSIVETSQVAWYWTIIANKVLTTDQINQVIAYFNLDRTLKPDILCNTIKQGITNENHAEFGDKLIDFSGNGRDIQLNNIAWKGDSGIGKYNFSNINIIANRFEGTVTTNKCHFTKKLTNTTNNFCDLVVISPNEPIKFKVSGLSDGRKLFVANKSGSGSNYNFDNGEHEVSLSFSEGVGQNNPFGVTGDIGDIDVTVEFIPSHAGALCLDGINDFGKATGMPIYKDYTFIIDREIISIGDTAGVVASKFEDSTDVNKQGAFLFEYLGAPNNISTWSFYKDNGKVANTDFTRGISYQSTYSYNGKDLTIGTSKDSDKLWLGTIRDRDSRFFNGAIYSLMSFPYSMSEFLIERQLKKHKLGTLYPNMVEFRPIIKSNVNYQDIIFRNTSTGENLIVGQYYNLASISIYVKPLYYEEVSTIKVNNINAEFNSYDKNTGYYRFDCIVTKSPQKINLTIEQDENYVLFNPIIKSNVEYHKLDFYLNNFEKRINIGDYIPKDVYIRANFYLKNNVDELTVFTFNGVNIDYRRSIVDDTAFNIGSIYNYDSPQEVNITIDEYIRYENIKQPYPVLLRFNDENGNEVSWGGKFRVGSTITRIGSIDDPESNLLNGLYSISGLSLNGKPVTRSTSIVEKQMVFRTTATYLLDDNEPKCILSPSRLRMPNSSYKLLGYIPDISGHGNHGKINNSAYAGMSGVNGYPVVFGANKTWANESNGYVTSITSNTIHITNVLNAGLALLYSYVKYNGNLQNIKEIPPFKIEIKGLEGRSKFIYKYLATSDATKETNLYLGNGTHELPKSFLPTEALINNAMVGFSISPIEEGVTNFLSDITIKVLPEYEGAYCLDGVNDFVSIPTTVGGKQMLMKVNWQKSPTLLYDQRASGSFAVLTTKEDDAVNSRIAYQGRNQDGKTYIDGIENNNIETYTLKDITHNITIANSSSGGIIVPAIGCNTGMTSSFAQMSLYDFMLFDEISTDDKIKELNEYVGIEGNTE